MKKQTRINVRLLRRVQKHILAEPKRLKMLTFLEEPYDESKLYKDDAGLLRRFPKCNTVGCIAGWACVFSGKKGISHLDFHTTAQKLLGITNKQALNLFIPAGYIWEQFRWNSPNPRTRANAVVRRIELFIKTKGEE